MLVPTTSCQGNPTIDPGRRTNTQLLYATRTELSSGRVGVLWVVCDFTFLFYMSRDGRDNFWRDHMILNILWFFFGKIASVAAVSLN